MLSAPTDTADAISGTAMITPDGYRVVKSLSSGQQAHVYSAVREHDNLQVVLKAHRGSGARTRAEREFQSLRAAAGPGVPEALELNLQDANAVLVLALVEGESMVASLASPLADSLGARLRIAIELADCIGRMHATRIIHKDIRPENVLIDRSTQHPWLIDFGRAAALGAASDRAAEVDFPQRTLLYVSPEGTGRMDRGLDARSDLYSFGALLYHMLTGRPPFDLTEAIELVHAHMAVLPELPVAVSADCPATLSRIAIKLLQKEPEDRYQSARSVADDLRNALDQLDRLGRIADDFPLGTSDSPQRPLFPRRLYGRERELEALTRGFERASGGTSEVWLIKGPPGAGKSALAEQLKARIHAAGGYHACGKFDLYRREVPYSGLVSAFDSLLQQRLAESSTQLEHFRHELVTGLGNLAGALAELVPDLRLVVGDVPPTPRLEPEQVRVRLALAVQRFVRACATPEHPLALCLDDLQWADGGSLQMIGELSAAQDPCALLLLGTYRDDELDRAHPLQALLSRLEARGAHTLEVGPLGESACAEMLATALQRTPEETLPLARQVAHKTANVPFLVEQFIGHARELGLVSFENGRGWVWDEQGIRDATIPESAVGLLAAKIERLDPKARRVLELASCVGDRFDAALLGELGGGSSEVLNAGLYQLSDEGLIAPCASGFCFVHDRIREAAHALLSDSERARWHHRAAQILHASLAPEARAARVLELADHFNRALGEIGADERISVVELNLAAAERALATGAPTSAAEYLSRGRALFRAADWTAQQQLGFNLWLRSAGCAYQLGHFEDCMALLDVIEPQAFTPVQAAAVTAQRIAVTALRDQLVPAVELGLSALRALGLRWPLHPSALRLWFAEARLALALGSRGASTFRPATGYRPATLARLMLVAALGGPAARVDLRFVSLTAAWAARLMARQGYSRGPDLALAALASYLCSRATRVRRARRYTALAAALNEQVNDPVYRYRAQCVLHGGVYPWLKGRVEAVEPLRAVFQEALEMGDREYAQYALSQRICTRAFSGVPLNLFDAEYREYLSIFFHGLVQRSLEGLLALQQPCDDDAIDAQLSALDTTFAEQPILTVHWRITWMLTLCILGRHEAVLAQGERLLEAPIMETLRPDLTFMRGLSAAAAAQERRRDRRALTRILATSLRQLAAWARHGPDFAHMVEILRAERAALRDRIGVARSCYANAARRAQQQGYLHHAALAFEREAALLSRIRRDTEAQAALDRARALYERWGAHAKVLRMRRSADALALP